MGMDMAVVNMFSLCKKSWKEYEGKSLLMLGKQRCSFTYNQFFENAENIDFEYQKEILSSLELNFDRLMDSYILFQLLGFREVSAMDISAYEGADIVFDLRMPELSEIRMNGGVEERYDIIFDGGTLEHIIDPIRAMDNIRRMVKLNGMVIHIVPAAQMTDHGVYSFSPTFFREYYGGKGFFIHHLDFCVTNKKENERETVFFSPDCRSINNQEYVEQYCNMPNRQTLIRCIAVKEKNIDKSILENEGMYSEVYAKADKYGRIRKPEILDELLEIINMVGEKGEQIALYGYGEIAFDIIDYIERKKCNLEIIACIIHTKKAAMNYKGVPVILLDELSEYPEVNSVYIASLSSNANLIYSRICHLERKGLKIVKIFDL